MRSIRARLVVWLLLCLLVGVLAAAANVYVNSRDAANALFDYELQQVATSLPAHALNPNGDNDLQDLPIAENMVIQVWDRSGLELFISRNGRMLPRQGKIGFATVRSSRGDWRVYTTLVAGRVVQVGQPTGERERVAADTALQTVRPLLILVPILGLVIWLVVGRGLRPLVRVARSVARRSATSLQPLEEGGLPTEVRPLVQALNGLLARLGQAIDVQRTFIADAAHELRSPLTALQLQAQLAERAGSEAERVAALRQLREGLTRATHLVQQLLTLARQEPDATEQRALVPVRLDELARRVVGEFAPRAQAADLDLGAAADEAVTVIGDPDALHTLLENLVDNAVRYTPAGGRVDVSVAQDKDGVRLTVADTGPGIAAAELPRVFDRFYRGEGNAVPGSGLGLAIVRNVADRHGARIDLACPGKGLRVTVTFAATDPGGRGQVAPSGLLRRRGRPDGAT